MYVGSRFWKRCSLVKAEEMDFVSGLAEIEADCYDEPPPRNWVEKVWAWLVSYNHFLVFRMASYTTLPDVKQMRMSLFHARFDGL